jgi:endonuclease G
LWVGYELTRGDLNGPAERANSFRQDRALRSPGANDRDYAGSGFSRGHMAPAEDFSRSDDAMRATFLLSNVVPQLQGVNGGRWAQLEVAVRKITDAAGAAYVFTGPVFAQEFVDVIGDGEVGVPTHTFKVALAIGPGGAKKMYAAIMPNSEKVTKPMNAFATTVREVERQTGFDFFSELPDAEEHALESRKESFPEPAQKKKPKTHR